jgi:predicted homoserine dehydrogenase-like protein
MMIVDRALAARAREGRPVRVGLVGAGFMGRGVARQLVRSSPGLRLAAVANRHLDGAVRAYADAGVDDVVVVEDEAGLARALEAGRPVVTEDALLLAGSGLVDVVCDVTGAVEHGAEVTLAAFGAGTHVVTMNAELDGTVGPWLAVLAERAGVVFSGADGDQPGVQRNLHRFVVGTGAEPLVCGNVKGLQDPYRTPTTQAGFAARWGQDPHMVTSFADGTKISFEQAVVANATGMTVARRGMGGADHDGHVDELVGAYDVEELRALGGVVDYVVGARPGPGVFVLAANDDPVSRHYLELYKLGTGPLYSFYVPYHLCHFEVPSSLARAVLFADPVIAAEGPPRVEVVTTAKRDLPAGSVLDGLGGYDTYGQAERADVAARERLLPMGVAEGCRLLRDVRRDEVLVDADVARPPGRLVDRLREEQDAHFGLTRG